MIGCKNKNRSFLGSHYIETHTNLSEDFPKPNTYFVPLNCQHCASPTCVPACPKGIFTKRDDGIVAVGDTSACEQCASKPCVKACPYGQIDLDPQSGRVGKCDLCADIIDEGGIPKCVPACLTQSILFGDFDDPESIVSQAVMAWSEAGYDHQLKPETGNAPTNHFLLSRKQWEDMDKLYSPAWHNE
jgi:Fe-S-cluster-containing dehydrogenase component